MTKKGETSNGTKTLLYHLFPPLNNYGVHHFLKNDVVILIQYWLI